MEMYAPPRSAMLSIASSERKGSPDESLAASERKRSSSLGRGACALRPRTHTKFNGSAARHTVRGTWHAAVQQALESSPTVGTLTTARVTPIAQREARTNAREHCQPGARDGGMQVGR